MAMAWATFATLPPEANMANDLAQNPMFIDTAGGDLMTSRIRVRTIVARNKTIATLTMRLQDSNANDIINVEVPAIAQVAVEVDSWIDGIEAAAIAAGSDFLVYIK
jgi:hypothetical protein